MNAYSSQFSARSLSVCLFPSHSANAKMSTAKKNGENIAITRHFIPLFSSWSNNNHNEKFVFFLQKYSHTSAHAFECASFCPCRMHRERRSKARRPLTMSFFLLLSISLALHGDTFDTHSAQRTQTHTEPHDSGSSINRKQLALVQRTSNACVCVWCASRRKCNNKHRKRKPNE